MDAPSSRIAAPGFYDLAPEAYHADPCERPSVSSGIISTIVTDTLAAARWKHPRLNPDLEPDDNTNYDLGSVAHELVLGKGSGIVVIDADDWRKKDTQEQRDAALEAGRQPCLAKVYEQACAMRDAAREQLAHDPENRDFFEAPGVSEQVAIWGHETDAGNIFCRAMMDRRLLERPAIYDYKTFKPGADPDGFVKYLFREGRAVQDPFYSMGLCKLLGTNWFRAEFRYVVQSPDAPYVLSVIQLDEQARDLAWQQTSWALEVWGKALRDGHFPGYRPRTHYVAPPPYEVTRWDDRMAADQHADALDARAA